MENPTPFSSQCCEFWQLRVTWLSPQWRHRMNPLFTKFPCGLLKMAPVPISRLATPGPFSVPWLCTVQDVGWVTSRRQLFELAPYLGSCIWDSFVLQSRVHCVDVPRFAEGLLSFLFDGYRWYSRRRTAQDVSARLSLAACDSSGCPHLSPRPLLSAVFYWFPCCTLWGISHAFATLTEVSVWNFCLFWNLDYLFISHWTLISL